MPSQQMCVLDYQQGGALPHERSLKLELRGARLRDFGSSWSPPQMGAPAWTWSSGNAEDGGLLQEEASCETGTVDTWRDASENRHGPGKKN